MAFRRTAPLSRGRGCRNFLHRGGPSRELSDEQHFPFAWRASRFKNNAEGQVCRRAPGSWTLRQRLRGEGGHVRSPHGSFRSKTGGGIEEAEETYRTEAIARRGKVNGVARPRAESAGGGRKNRRPRRKRARISCVTRCRLTNWKGFTSTLCRLSDTRGQGPIGHGAKRWRL